MLHDECVAILYRALRSEFGIRVRTPSQAQAISKLRETIKATGDAELMVLHVKKSPNDPNEVWVIRGKDAEAS